MTEFREITQEFLDDLRAKEVLLNIPSDQILRKQQRKADKQQRAVLGEALLGDVFDYEPDNPSGNTGLFYNTPPIGNNSQQVAVENKGHEVAVLSREFTRFMARVHWLQGTFKYDEYPQLQILGEKLESLFGDTFEWNCGAFTRGLKFHDHAKSSSGIMMAWQRPRDSKQGMCWLSIPGAALDRLMGDDGDDTRIYMLFHLLSTGTVGSTSTRIFSHWKTTRLDTAVDDLHKVMRPIDIRDIAKAGNFTGFRNKPVFDKHLQDWLPPSYDFHESAACDADGNVMQAGTLTFGSGQSDKTLTIYDKFLESDGKIDSVRWEARWKDEYSQVRFIHICNCLFEEGFETLPQLLARMTMGAIDFIDIESATRVCNCKRLSFWEEMLAQLGRVKFPLQTIIKVIEQTVDWIEHQVSTSIAMIEQIAGFEDLMNGLIDLKDMGMSRLNKHHRMQIDQAKKDGFDFSQYLHQILEKRRSFTDKELAEI